ncbi:MAG: hypothetical protein BWY99_02802 [Synergistetes bacterium ADurb.BinA166]|nr:MAG: hypothetical protein BWY99_02802 [Synergistetes bacterium ADurb.BinA166]
MASSENRIRSSSLASHSSTRTRSAPFLRQISACRSACSSTVRTCRAHISSMRSLSLAISSPRFWFSFSAMAVFIFSTAQNLSRSASARRRLPSEVGS